MEFEGSTRVLHRGQRELLARRKGSIQDGW